MIETTGDLWGLARDADAVVITTNGYVNRKGEAVMGRGCALEAKRLHPWLPLRLGAEIRNGGNHVHHFTISPEQGARQWLVTFPVKTAWWETASLMLITQSKHELVKLADQYGWTKIVMPRPGCGNGNLVWDVVRPIISRLDDRFVVTTYG